MRVLPVLLLVALAALARGGEALAVAPAFLRLDLAPQDVVEVELAVTAPPGTVISHVAVDCACLGVRSALPATVDAAGRWALRLRATGLRPGVEDVLIGTSAGVLRAQLQLVGPGAGRGREQLAAVLGEAAAGGFAVLGILHDLRGEVRHCGCSLGALGGAGRLARLPALARELAPGVAARWVLSGDSDGMRPGVGAALIAAGWGATPPEVRASAEPLALLAAPGVSVVIPTVPVAVQHRRLVRPLLDRGMAVEAVLLDAAGAVRGHRTVPIDDSLPEDPALPARFADRLSARLDPAAQPAQACAPCHATAYAAWQSTRHARALDSLPPADRTDGCIGCHTTPVAAAVLAPAVTCQSCHQGGEAHIASAGTLRTAGTLDCRTCHDAKHHPAFRRDTAWPLIQHGREGAAGR